MCPAEAMEVAAAAVGEEGTAMETEEMERRKALSAQFAAITGCSAAAACEALGGHDWHLEVPGGRGGMGWDGTGWDGGSREP